MIRLFASIGRYFLLMAKVFSRPEKSAIYRRRIVYEMEALGVDSIGLTASTSNRPSFRARSSATLRAKP